MENLGSIIRSVREKNPLVHHITNYVTVNDCANITLCIGASPVMAHAEEEVEEMVSMAGALVLNIGTLDSKQVERMLIAGKAAETRDIPIILDPVGAGATTLRTRTAQKLIKELSITILKGNAGEIGTLAGIQSEVRGVDSGGVMGDPVVITQKLAETLDLTVVMSGISDIISDGNRVFIVDNGHAFMGRLSGTGCMAASITGACATVSSDYVRSSTAGITAFGIAGERAAAEAKGPGSFKYRLFDSVASVTGDDVNQFGKVRVL